MKLMKEYEKKVNEAKVKVRKQMKRAAEGFISAIKSQLARMTEDLDEMFKSELKPMQVTMFVICCFIFCKEIKTYQHFGKIIEQILPKC